MCNETLNLAEFQGAIKRVGIQGRTYQTKIIVLDTNGYLWSCGYNLYGEAGQLSSWTTDPNGIFNKALVEDDVKFIDFRVFGTYSLPGIAALTEDGRVYVCGYNYLGQTGTNIETNGSLKFYFTEIFFD